MENYIDKNGALNYLDGSGEPQMCFPSGKFTEIVEDLGGHLLLRSGSEYWLFKDYKNKDICCLKFLR